MKVIMKFSPYRNNEKFEDIHSMVVASVLKSFKRVKGHQIFDPNDLQYWPKFLRKSAVLLQSVSQLRPQGQNIQVTHASEINRRLRARQSASLRDYFSPGQKLHADNQRKIAR